MKIIDINRALTIINNFRNSTILVVGDLMVDHYIYGTSTRVSPEAPVPIVDVQSEKIFLGGSGNVINNIYDGGGKVFATGVIGCDETSEIISDVFMTHNIEVDGLIRDPDRYTTLKTRIIAHEQQVARYDLETKNDANLKDTITMLDYIYSKKDLVDVIVISDYNKGTITKDLINGILKITSESDIKICVDPKRLDLSFYNGVDIITPNHVEAERSIIANSSGRVDLNIETIGKKLLESLNFKAILITRSENGMSLFERKDNEIIHTNFGSKVVNVCDVSGAGDTVIGIFSLCVASGATFLEATEISNIAAGIVVSKLGTATITIKELEDSL